MRLAGQASFLARDRTCYFQATSIGDAVGTTSALSAFGEVPRARNMVMSIKLLACFLATASAFKVQSKPIEAPLLKLRGGSLADVSVGTVNLVNALYYGGYGVPLLVYVSAASLSLYLPCTCTFANSAVFRPTPATAATATPSLAQRA